MKEEIIYPGEHVWAGNLGNAFISLAIATALFSCIAYFLSLKNPGEKSFRNLGRIFFSVHSFSVFGMIGTMFFMMLNHYYEYAYVWKHTSSDTETRYVFAAFWEGQEGSFMLWTFWHAVIGLVLMFTSKKWEAPAMAVLSLVQVFLGLMVIGLYLFDAPVGSNPFVLMRDHPEFRDLPLFGSYEIKDGLKYNYYAEKIGKTARGLNPLLKNYWMTIHPPTLFLGFALTVVPFCFSLGGLITRRHTEWQKTALPWTFAGVLVLGTGILMGGAWAYEALSFGGFWAWDPVENASFVPWLILVGAAHLMLVNRSTGHSYFATYIFSSLTFILVLYSTFLTRSGILGDSSVHAFTDLGMEHLLIFFLLFFIALPVTFLVERFVLALNYFLVSVLIFIAAESLGYRSVIYPSWFIVTLGIVFYSYFKSWMPKAGAEESAWSREFWIFIGSLLLLLFAGAVSIFTSLPVFNKIFGTKMTLKDNGMNLYNVGGIIFGCFILLLVAVTQYFKYKKTDMKGWMKKFIYSGLAAALLTVIIGFRFFNREAYEASTEIQRNVFYLAPAFIFVALFAVFSNLEYWLKVLKGKIRNAGSSIAHVGFALVMLGCVVSNSGKRIISKNTSDRDISSLGKKFSNNTNIFLAKGDTLKMGGYFVTYKGKIKDGIHIRYEVEYYKKVNGKNEYQFTLYPRVQLNERMGNSAEPDTRHFFNKDIYTDVTYAELSSKAEQDVNHGWTETENHVLHEGDSIVTNEHIIVLDSLKTSLTEEQYKKQDSMIIVTAVMSVFDMEKNVRKVYPQYVLRNREVSPAEYIDDVLGLKFVFWKINPEEGSVEITHSEKVEKKTDFIVMEAFEFPWINILWTGCVVMIFGTGLAVVHRVKQNRLAKNAS